jgi:hypothetical protein
MRLLDFERAPNPRRVRILLAGTRVPVFTYCLIGLLD